MDGSSVSCHYVPRPLIPVSCSFHGAVRYSREHSIWYIYPLPSSAPIVIRGPANGVRSFPPGADRKPKKGLLAKATQQKMVNISGRSDCCWRAAPLRPKLRPIPRQSALPVHYIGNMVPFGTQALLLKGSATSVKRNQRNCYLPQLSPWLCFNEPLT